MIESDPRNDALAELAKQGRRLADALISTPATVEQLQTATKELRALLESLPVRGENVNHLAEASLAVESFGKAIFAEQSPIFGYANITAPPISLDVVDDHVEATANFGVVYEGPPGHVHGGWTAAVFDEVLGLVQSLTGKPGMTGRLEVSYRRPTPLHTPIDFFGYIDRVEGRKIFTTGHSVNRSTGERLAEVQALFISIDFDRFTSPTRPSGLGHIVDPAQIVQNPSAPTNS